MPVKTINQDIIHSIAKLAKGDGSRVHVISRGAKWIIKREGGSRALGIYTTQGKAVSAAQSYIQKGKYRAAVVHNVEGGVDRTII
jgi:hypothetical protein